MKETAVWCRIDFERKDELEGLSWCVGGNCFGEFLSEVEGDECKIAGRYAQSTHLGFGKLAVVQGLRSAGHYHQKEMLYHLHQHHQSSPKSNIN